MLCSRGPVRRSKGNGRGASGASIDACSQPEDEPRPNAKARKAEATGHSSGHIGPQPARKSEPANPEKPPTRIVVAHNGGNITGTSFKTKSASNMSASSRRSKPRSEASCPSELLETPRSEGCSVSRASPAASSRSRTSPSRERLALEKSAAEAAQRSAPVQLRTWILPQNWFPLLYFVFWVPFVFHKPSNFYIYIYIYSAGVLVPAKDRARAPGGERLVHQRRAHRAAQPPSPQRVAAACRVRD